MGALSTTGRLAARCAGCAIALGLIAAVLGGAFPKAAFGAGPGQDGTAGPGQPYDISISDLSNADESYDKQTVQVVGEVVGDRIVADDAGGQQHYWILLTSSQTESNDSIAVYMTASDASKIDSFGRYNVKGTTLQVKGTFNLACPQHDGQSDLHAEQVSVVEKGAQSTEAFDIRLFVPGIIAVVVGVLLLVAYRQIRERRR